MPRPWCPRCRRRHRLDLQGRNQRKTGVQSHSKKAEAQGDDIKIRLYRHTNLLDTWYLDEGEMQGFTEQFELDANGGEMFFFTLQVDSTWREFKYDPTVFRVQVYVKQ